MTRSDFFRTALAFIAAPIIAKLEPLAFPSAPPAWAKNFAQVTTNGLYPVFYIFIPMGDGSCKRLHQDGTIDEFVLRWKDNKKFNEVEAIKINKS